MGLAATLVEQGIEGIGRFYSVYRALVLDIDDPLQMDRIKVYLPYLGVCEWALPKGHGGSHNTGFRQQPLPKLQEIVYVTFENGNLAKPLWEWHGWAEDQMPDEFLDPDVCGLITPKGTKILINDRTGEVDIKAKTAISLNVESGNGIGVVVTADKINIIAKEEVVINKGEQGVPDIVPLTEKLNKLVKEVNQLRTTFNTHTHAGVQSGSSVTPTPTQPATTPISQFNKKDYEDLGFLH